MKVFIISVLLILTAGLSYWNFFPRGKFGPAALQVFSKPPGAQVSINDNSVGVTPYKNQGIKSGDIKLVVGTGSASFAKIIKLNPKVVTVVNRELSDNLFLQAGEILSLEAGAGLAISSTPDGAQVEIDDKKAGTAPAHIKDIQPGAHKVVISKDNFVSRAIQVEVHSGYQLTLEATLATTAESLAKILGSPLATPAATLAPKVKILSTPTGFLRVRDNPTFGAGEIGRVNPGEDLILLEEKPDWFKIRLVNNREGWISAQYAKKL